jgi:predicted TIM-barrel fold metal-dependent hydrolase
VPPAAGALAVPLPALDDPEGAAVPDGLPPVIDAHVHVFPDRLMGAVRAWFDAHGWPVRYRLDSEALIEFLLRRGIEHLVLLLYAHRPGMARDLNRYVAGLCRGQPRVTGLATVFPGEPGAAEILEEGFALGLAGVKLHQHVQCFEADSAGVREVCRVCAGADKPLLAHLGREPRSPSYRCDPHALCAAAHVERLLVEFPGLRLCVPHLGADEFAAYRRLCGKFDNLWLDTTMMLAGYFRGLQPPPLTEYPEDRLLYGTDFCHLPYAWDRELRRIRDLDLPPARLEKLLAGNARTLFDIPRVG